MKNTNKHRWALKTIETFFKTIHSFEWRAVFVCRQCGKTKMVKNASIKYIKYHSGLFLRRLTGKPEGRHSKLYDNYFDKGTCSYAKQRYSRTLKLVSEDGYNKA